MSPFQGKVISIASVLPKINRKFSIYLRFCAQHSFLTRYSSPYASRGSINPARDPLGYVPSHIWGNQRPADARLEGLLFKNLKIYDHKCDSDEEKFLANTLEAKLSGQPVSSDLSYPVTNAVSDISHLDRRLHENLHRMGLDQLTPIQRHAIGLMSIDDVISVNVGTSSMPETADKPQSAGVQPDLERIVGRYDLMTAAQTGSGKTLAYLIPIINRLMRVYPFEAMQAQLKAAAARQFPSSLILAPTRELVQQILSEANKLCYRTFVRPVGLFGGERPSRQLFELSRGGHVIVATPGRLIDFLQQGVLHLEHCRTLVLDEADRMLDMGFEEQLRQILGSPKFGMPPAKDLFRQTCLYSATFPREVTLIAKDFLRGPRCISLTLLDPEHNTGTLVPEWGGRSPRADSGNEIMRLSRIVPREIDQCIELVDGGNSQLEERLIQFVGQMVSGADGRQEAGGATGSDGVDEPRPTQSNRVLVFCNTKRQVDSIDAALYRSGLLSAPIHGDKSQSERSRALELFRRGSINVLVASSVASRGLDIPNVRAVVNVGLPVEVEDYVHRIGRTGRMGHSGVALTLVSSADVQDLSSQVANGVLQLIEKSKGSLDDLHPRLLHFLRYSRDGGSQRDSPPFGRKPHRTDGRGGRYDAKFHSRKSSDTLLQRRYK